MTSAGHYQGAGLPTLRFLFVEGEQTRAAALSLFNMWRTATGVAVELVGVSAEELDAALAAGDFDLALTTLTARWRRSDGVPAAVPRHVGEQRLRLPQRHL